MDLQMRLVATDRERAVVRELDGDTPESRAGRTTIAAWSGEELLGATDLEQPGSEGFGPQLVAVYDFARFADRVTVEHMAVIGPRRVRAQWRDHAVDAHLVFAAARTAGQRDIRLLFGCTEPRTLGSLRRLGFVSYLSPFQDPELGWQVPAVLDLHDTAHLERVGSPLFRVRPTEAAPAAPRSGRRASRADWLDVQRLLYQRSDRASFLKEVSETGLAHLMQASHILDVEAGDAVIRRGDKARTLFVVLRGTLEVRLDGDVVGVLSEGDVFGEVAFLLESERTADVFAVSDDVRLLELSEATLRTLLRQDPMLAARVSLGLARALCWKLVAKEPG